MLTDWKMPAQASLSVQVTSSQSFSSRQLPGSAEAMASAGVQHHHVMQLRPHLLTAQRAVLTLRPFTMRTASDLNAANAAL